MSNTLVEMQFVGNREQPVTPNVISMDFADIGLPTFTSSSYDTLSVNETVTPILDYFSSNTDVMEVFAYYQATPDILLSFADSFMAQDNFSSILDMYLSAYDTESINDLSFNVLAYIGSGVDTLILNVSDSIEVILYSSIPFIIVEFGNKLSLSESKKVHTLAESKEMNTISETKEVYILSEGT